MGLFFQNESDSYCGKEWPYNVWTNWSRLKINVKRRVYNCGTRSHRAQIHIMTQHINKEMYKPLTLLRVNYSTTLKH